MNKKMKVALAMIVLFVIWVAVDSIWLSGLKSKLESRYKNRDYQGIVLFADKFITTNNENDMTQNDVDKVFVPFIVEKKNKELNKIIQTKIINNGYMDILKYGPVPVLQKDFTRIADQTEKI